MGIARDLGNMELPVNPIFHRGGRMALLQTTIDDDVKKRADEVFARSGLTSAMAVRVMVTQVANTGVSPFDGLFLGKGGRAYSDEVRRAMVREEAKEYGLIPDDAQDDPARVPDDLLDTWGITAEEVGQ